MRIQYLTLAYTGMRIDGCITRRPQEIGPRVIRVRAPHDWSPKGYPRYTGGVRDVPVGQGRLRPA